MFAGAVAAAATNDDHGKPLGVTVDWLPNDYGQPTEVAVTPGDDPTGSGEERDTPAPVATEQPATPDSTAVTGFAYPIAGACLPVEDSLMPGAPREYRNGIHEGVDFYDIDNCASIGLDTAVMAAKAGTVVRADHDYVDITPEEVAALEQDALENGSSDEIEDTFRGRQIWIDHGDGVVTRYAHLNGIAEDIQEGTVIEQGELIGFVGDSGTPESVTEPGSEVHLHFEIRVGDSYLGAGLDPIDVRALFEEAFAS